MEMKQTVLITGTPEELAEYVLRTKATSLLVAGETMKLMVNLMMASKAEDKPIVATGINRSSEPSDRDMKRALVLMPDALHLERHKLATALNDTMRSRVGKRNPGKIECVVPDCKSKTNATNGLCARHRKILSERMPKAPKPGVNKSWKKQGVSA